VPVCFRVTHKLACLLALCGVYTAVPIATGAIKTMRTNVVGAGLVLKAQVDYECLGISEEDAQKLESSIEREFALWSPECDIERFDSFAEIQQLCFLNWLMSGDVIVLLPSTKRVGSPYDLRIQLIEADRLCTPDDSDGEQSKSKGKDKNIIGGVEVNKNGEVVAYHIRKTHPLSASEFDTGGADEFKKIEAFGKITGRRNVIHIMNRERIGQRRGVPFLAPVIEAFKQLGRYTTAEIDAAVLNALWAVFIEKGENSPAVPPFPGAPGDSVGGEVDSGNPDPIEFSPGSIVDLADGEKANLVTPGRPNPNFDAFVAAFLKYIGTALEIPYEVLTKHFGSSYSASRGALLELWKSVKMYRSWLANDFCQPIYEEWLGEAVAKNRIAAPGFFTDPAIRKAYSGAEWNGPAQLSLDPVREVNAARMRVENGFSTRDREAQEQTGGDFYRIVKNLKKEEALMREVRDIEIENSQ